MSIHRKLKGRFPPSNLRRPTVELIKLDSSADCSRSRGFFVCARTNRDARCGKGAHEISSVGCYDARCEANGISPSGIRSEEHTSELQSQSNLVCRLLLEKKKKKKKESDQMFN